MSEIHWFEEEGRVAGWEQMSKINKVLREQDERIEKLTAELQEARRERDELLGARCDAETQRIMLRNVERQLADSEKAAEALRAALTEARCWITDGSRRTPEQRGAKCETCIDAREAIDAALREQPATKETCGDCGVILPCKSYEHREGCSAKEQPAAPTKEHS